MKQSRKNSMLRGILAPLLAAAFLALLPVPSEGTGVSVVNLHSFDVFLNGSTPYGSLVQGPGGLFFGTTFEGGIDNAGVVFEVASNGVMSVLYSFTNGVDGGFPEAGLALANDGNFYGTTFEGGVNDTGVVFQITPAGVFNPLYSFTAVSRSGENQDGAYPAAGLIQATDGNLYGTTSTGGADGSGTLFKISLGGSFEMVYTFSVLDINGENSEGSTPQSALVQGTDGNLYGTAELGGSNGFGAVFEYNLSQSQISPLYSFMDAGDGAKPDAALVQGTDGNFYSTTSEGGSNTYGALFKITSSGAFTPLYSFTNGKDGGNPVAPLVQGANGNFYGTSTGPQNGFGTVFEMTTNGAVTPLYSFTGRDDGAYPEAGLVQAADGDFFGTTSSGGTNDSGTVFSITSSGAFSQVMSFVGGDDGDDPQAPLVQGTNGNFYGTTYQGGTAGYGVVFELTANGALTSLYSFTNGQDGANPAGGLVQGTDGNLYGTTYTGGANHDGVLFNITPQGALTVLHSLTNQVEGSHPLAGLVQGTDGNFYGTTYQGGSSSEGAIFQMAPGGAVTRLYAFTNGVDGSYPKAGLVQGIDGSFYGTATLGGSNNHGTVFKITSGGAFTPLYSFTNGVDGATPQSSLALGADGNFYGTTADGGSNGFGVVFQITSTGSFTPLYSFTDGIDGATPEAGLALGADGNLYGTASAGGTYFIGTLFEITTGGKFTPLYSFVDTSDGAEPDGAGPVAPLVLGSDGNFYGTASSGGASGGGTAFRVALSELVAPRITSIVYGAISVTVTWSVVPAQLYQLQVASSLPNWGALGIPMTGTNGSATYVDTTIGDAQRYYRVYTYPP
jgi:uncharacterized repeat protein (TIGR03803 family)